MALLKENEIRRQAWRRGSENARKAYAKTAASGESEIGVKVANANHL